MSIPTPVNGQITDAITQATLPVIGEAPAMAMGALYQSLAHATGILFENAVAAQQQQAIAAQAAANQGIMQIYSVDTTAGATAGSAVHSPESVDANLRSAKSAVSQTADAPAVDVNAQVSAALKLANEAVLGRAADVAYTVRACADAFNAGLAEVSRTLHADLLRSLHLAATAACLQAMLKQPQRAEEYERVLGVIGKAV